MAHKIACLGWGSLIGNPGTLRLNGDWQNTGPQVKVEFVRRSQENHLTLVLFPDAERALSSLWAWMDVASFEEAVDNLAKRERCDKKHIGSWPQQDGAPTIIDLESWARNRGADNVIWTALPSKWRNDNGLWEDGRWPEVDDAVQHLKGLKGKQAERAKQYVQCAPEQINTAYRERFADVLDWQPRSLDECRCSNS